ncbi:hypothetical protein C942_00489 [Photobacterium marinum]|uniref:triacylglycerol lipase n=1 Tax=Photobacterium marinum TaxID=1056511 RepID=L8JF49_9GAMM|nr:hypothetical protein [Photobacterium marinum]ELR66047.1 hypothetical protein C942_00489 [Photobacterium marinum]
MAEKNNYPIIFVHGILGWGEHEAGFGDYWGRAHDVEGYKIEFASVGPISSYWDRARELFYQIKGYKEDDCDRDCVYKCDGYEELHIHKETLTDHLKVEKLPNWKKGNKPLYSAWDKDHPIHLVGHSQGAWTILLLQYMLAQGDLFPPYKTSARWIRSVTSISGVLNGTTAPYAVCNFDEKTGYYKGTSYPFILNRRLMYDFLGLSPINLLKTRWHAFISPYSNWDSFMHDVKEILKTGGYNWDLDQWSVTRKNKSNIIYNEKLEMLLNMLFIFKVNLKDFVYGKDNAAYCLSVIGTIELNKLFKVYEDTTYFSYVTQQKPKDFHFFLKRFGKAIGNYSIKKLIKTEYWPEKNRRWPAKAEIDELWQKNDGLVPVISQQYPWLGVEEENYFPVSEYNDEGVLFWPKSPRAGNWYTMNNVLNGWDHTDIVFFPQKKGSFQWNEQYWFYLTLCSNLNKLPILHP